MTWVSIFRLLPSIPNPSCPLTEADLNHVAHQLNGRPRQTLDGMTLSERLAETLQ